MLTPRENMMRTIRCQESEWIPVTVYIDPYNHPDPDSLPADLCKIFKKRVRDWDSRWELVILLSEYLGVDEYMLNADRPFRVVIPEDMETKGDLEAGRNITKIKLPSGEMTQIRKSGFTTKHFVEEPEDIKKFKEYVEAWNIEPDRKKIEEISQMKDRIKDGGMIWLFTEGTPLGMMCRIYADIESLIYMVADFPSELEELFEIMESKYMEMFELTLNSCPEIDILVGMDDTSTNIISPAMFERYNARLTDKRTELAHKHGKLYLHHSCGLIRDLLPVYRKTKMDGVHALTIAPMGDVATYTQGRKLLGNNVSIIGNFQTGLKFPDKEMHSEIVRQRLQDARNAGFYMTYLTTPDYNHGVDFMQRGLEEARKFQKY